MNNNVCEICGKALKNNHGRLVHEGRMHKIPTVREVALMEWVKILEGKIDALTEQVNLLSGDFACGGIKRTKTVPKAPPKRLYVAEGFVDELKDVLALRGVTN